MFKTATKQHHIHCSPKFTVYVHFGLSAETLQSNMNTAPAPNGFSITWGPGDLEITPPGLCFVWRITGIWEACDFTRIRWQSISGLRVFFFCRASAATSHNNMKSGTTQASECSAYGAQYNSHQ